MNSYYPTSTLLDAAEAHVQEHAPTMTLTDLAVWCYLEMGRDALLTKLEACPQLVEQYLSSYMKLHGERSAGNVPYPMWVEENVSLAMATVAAYEAIEIGSIDLQEQGSTLFDNAALRVWMVTGSFPQQDWCEHMPWSVQTSKALEEFTLLLNRDEAIEVAAQWHGGEWSALYGLASTGKVADLESLVNELDECLDEAMGSPIPTAQLNNLVAYICFVSLETCNAIEDDCFGMDEY